ncbi:hypothetical protein F3Y22_tig00113156pilonHSYRG00095 [Hibiscus syriacus]|uniref:Uncharacterized protein n=1 Tax=Hibiscus syriacus TaxID=106335 RepID=A0A6A2X6F4_HIBSY|nr:hypothetical protein F3Y22_tig00113156pilonHSYRG00095 [Hibiscus syriacus]
MFGSTSSFGQSSNSPFASQSVFGQTNNTNSNPFAPNPSFGSVTPFGTQTAGSIFGGTSTGVFGAAQSSSPFSSTTAFGASSSSAFGSSMPAFGSSSTPAFGSSSSSFGGDKYFVDKVVDKPAPIRISSSLTSRYLSQRRIRLPARKYRPDKDNPKVPFFSDDEETPSVPKADTMIFPRENPRSLVIRPTENWPSRASAEKGSPLKDASSPVHENGEISDDGSKAEDKDENPAENDHVKLRIHPVKGHQRANVVQDDHSAERGLVQEDL